MRIEVIMGKGKPRAVEKGVLGQGSSLSSPGSLNIAPGPVFYPTEEEFRDPLKFIYKIRPEAEPYGICKIVPPKSWKPQFALDLDSFTFPTKTQAIHQLQVRPAACDSKTFELEYNRFLEEQCDKKAKKKLVFEGKDLDLCKLFNAVKRYGGYDNVVKEKKWGEIFRFVRSLGKISECAKHVLCQLYREHLYDYERYINRLNRERNNNVKRLVNVEKECGAKFKSFGCKRRRKNNAVDKVAASKVEYEEFDQVCEQCTSGLHGEVMLLCDRCNRGWHTYCLSPPLKRIPPGNWYCSECLNSEKDSFGFVPGKQFSLEAFRRIAERAKKKWFGSISISRVQMEKKFWEIVEGSVGEVEVMYGSDLDTSVYGSGFPRLNDQRPPSIGVEEWNEICVSPWNLNNLPKLQGSMLQAVPHSIAGVMVPWLYVGMLFSSFCWHFEDHCFYSMNYHHWGEPKCWYSVPGSEASAFEKVMRDSLPDLFDAQPDLLFQLVTMLNPSVLQQRNVPVYSVLQEPGNFVITFPRSYHGGFNFGLNCAEAVNFAPADWLPHGGFGAELYQLYRKPAVLSHEELLCVVVKSDTDSKALPYLKNELIRVYDKERTWREWLWKNGIISFSPMSPRKQPQYVGVEEDPLCIICQQFLYLSAVGCRCRPSVFVCLEHWEHLCECKPQKHYLLYRHTLAELNDLVLTTEMYNSEETDQIRKIRKQSSCSGESNSLSKKVKGGIASLVQLAEEWLLRACKILQMPYCNRAYATALKEAEQFLWAGPEMDSVREIAKNLVEAQKWADGVRECLSKIELWLCGHNRDTERVRMEDIDRLLSVDPVPCNEPGHLKLKVYEEEAKLLIRKINSVLSTRSINPIVDWENLHTEASNFAIHVKESEVLSHKLSSGKAWIKSVRKCISAKYPATIDIDILYGLKSQISELQLQLPEVELLLDFVRQVEACRSRCIEMLKGSITLKVVEALVQEYDGITVDIPELKLLRQYHSDAVAWVSHFNDVVKNVHEWEDQENAGEELRRIQEDGALLKIQVDELLDVEAELKKASCRVEALKALRSRMPLEFICEVMVKASVLQIEKEKVFRDICGVHAAGVCWEERAKHILESGAQMSEFEEAIRTSEDLFVLLPSLDDVKEALSLAKTWLSKAKPFLVSGPSVVPDSSPLLEVATMKELLSESKLLKMSLKERPMLQAVLKNCLEWEHEASALAHDVKCLLNSNDIHDANSNGLISSIELQLARVESVIKAGLSLHFNFALIPELQVACSTLRWCTKALSFHNMIPALEEVEMLLEVVNGQLGTYASYLLGGLLIDCLKWLKKSVEISLPCNLQRFKLSDAEEALEQSQNIKVSFPLMCIQLVNAIKRHKVWVEQVIIFFNLDYGDRSWSLLLQLKELGSSDAFNCLEMDMVLSEVEKVEQWKQRSKDIAGITVSDSNLLLNVLMEITKALDRCLYLYNKSNCCKERSLCMCCSSDSEDQELLTCSVCNDCYHARCVDTTQGGPSHAAVIICPYCHFIENGRISRNGSGLLKIVGKRPEISTLVDLLSDAENLCVSIEERSLLQQIVEKALECRTFVIDIVEFALASFDKNLNIIVPKLSTALKTIEVSGVYDHEVNCKFELALARNSWRVRACRLIEGSQKPSMQPVQRHLKEGLAVSIPLEDHFWQKLVEMKHVGLQWADKAKKVSTDSGALELDKVFELIAEGENLPIHFEKELEALRERSMLYCICRKPYDKRAMIACDKCDEWYHFDCIKLSSPPECYICPACKLETDEDNPASSSMTQERSIGKCEEPQTPSPCRLEMRRKSKKAKSKRKRKMLGLKNLCNVSKRESGIERLLWRNRKPFRRAARKRVELDILSPFFRVPQEQASL